MCLRGRQRQQQESKNEVGISAHLHVVGYGSGLRHVRDCAVQQANPANGGVKGDAHATDAVVCARSYDPSAPGAVAVLAGVPVSVLTKKQREIGG